ncbi:uncharacterized protein trim33l isoform 2-T2 [Anableps anableps]
METAGAPGDVQTLQCGSCEGCSASCWCLDCSEALCDACLAAHRRVTLTRSHRVLNHQPEGTSLISPIKFCRRHPSEELKLFCFTCSQLTCRDCQLADHKNHRFDFVSRAAESVRKRLDACMQPFRAQVEASRRSLQDMEMRLQVLSRCESFMTSNLQKHVDTLTELLKKRFEEITKQIQITAQLKDLEDEDSRPPSKMIDVKVITDRSSVEGILNFGKLHVSWIPFFAPRVDPPASSSSSPLVVPPTSTCRPPTCSPATANCDAVDVAAPPSPTLSSINTFITASNLSPPSSRTSPQTGCGTAAASPAPPLSSAVSVPPASPCAPPPASTCAPPPASTFNAAVVKSRTAQTIRARNPYLCSLLGESSPYSSPPAGSFPSSTDPAHGQSSSSHSSSSLVSEVLPQTTTIKGPGRVEDRSEGAKPAGKRYKETKETSRGSDSAVKINILTKSQLESSSEKLFVKFQWMKRKKTSRSSTSSSSSVAGSPKIRRLLSGKQQPLWTQNQPGDLVLPNPQTVVQSSPSVPSTYLVSPQVVSTTVQSASVQPVRDALPLGPDPSPPNGPILPSLVLSQQLVPSQNPPAVLVLTNTSPTYPVIGSGPGLPSSVSVGPQASPGNVPSVQQSPAAPGLQNLPDYNNLLLLEHFTSSVGLPFSTLKDQQQNPASKQMDKPNEPNKPITETLNRLVEVSSTGIVPPADRRSSEPNNMEPTVTGAPDQELIMVLSDENEPAEDESLPEVYEVQPTVDKIQSFLSPVSPDEISVVEYKPPGDESRPTTSKFKERDVFGEPASPVISEDRMSTALSEEPEFGLKLSSSETSDSEDETMVSLRTEQQDYSQHYWQPTVSLVRLPLSLPGPGCPLPRYRFILGDKKDELYLQEVEEDAQSSDETITDHASDITEDFTELHSPESPLSLEVISCAACGSSSASKICTVCGRGYHRDCHVPPFGPDIWSELVCSLCQDLSDPSDPYSSDRPKSPHGASLSLQDQRRCETLLLHLKVEGCRRFSQLDLWSDLTLISERLSRHLSPPYQTAAQVVSDLWDLFSDASQGNRLVVLQRSFQRKLVETLGSELPPSLLVAPNPAFGPEGPSGSFDCGENFLSESKVKVLKKRLKDFLDLKGPSAAKRPKKTNPE